MSCANAGGLFGDRVAFQGLEVSNAGRSNVSGVSVLYGSHELVTGSALAKFAANRTGLDKLSEGFDGPIAEKTLIGWVTDDDGVAHNATIPTRSLVREIDVFYGFRFYFVDAHVDVYLIEKKPTPSRFLSLKYTKVYTSP